VDLPASLPGHAFSLQDNQRVVRGCRDAIYGLVQDPHGIQWIGGGNRQPIKIAWLIAEASQGRHGL
jgi:hypothetical protein